MAGRWTLCVHLDGCEDIIAKEFDTLYMPSGPVGAILGQASSVVLTVRLRAVTSGQVQLDIAGYPNAR